MKAHFHQLTLALLACAFCATGRAQTLFGKEYPVELNNVSWVRGVGLPTGGLMVSARPTGITANTAASSILTTDEVGDVVSLVRYEHGSSDMITCMERMSNGEIMVGSSSRDHFAPDTDMLIKRLDPMGNVVWCKAMRPYTSPSTLYDLVEPVPGVLIGLGLVEDSLGPPLLFRFDDMGNLAWSRILVSTGAYLKGMDIATDPAGGVIFSGFYSDTVQASKMLVVHVDLNGNIDWAHTYGSGSNNDAAATLVDPNGGLAIVGRLGIAGSSPGSVPYSGGVIRTDASGIPYSMFRWISEPKAGHCFADGSLLLYSGVPDWKTGFIRVDTANTVQWSALLAATSWGEVVPLYGSSRFAYVSSKIFGDVTINTLTDQLQACDGDTLFDTALTPTWESHAPVPVSSVPISLNSVDVPITMVQLVTSMVLQCSEYVGVEEHDRHVEKKMKCGFATEDQMLSITGLERSHPALAVSDVMGRRWPVGQVESAGDGSVQLALPSALAPGYYIATAGAKACTFIVAAW